MRRRALPRCRAPDRRCVTSSSSGCAPISPYLLRVLAHADVEAGAFIPAGSREQHESLTAPADRRAPTGGSLGRRGTPAAIPSRSAARRGRRFGRTSAIATPWDTLGVGVAEWRLERRADGTWLRCRRRGTRAMVAHAVTDADDEVWVHVDGEVIVRRRSSVTARAADSAARARDAGSADAGAGDCRAGRRLATRSTPARR